MPTPTQREKRPRGRPSVGAGGATEVLNFIVSTDDMDQVRAELDRLGAGATVAGWVRDAIREKLERGRSARGGIPRTQQDDHAPQKTPRPNFSE